MSAGEWGFEPTQPGSSVLALKPFGLGPKVDCPVQKYSSGQGGDPRQRNADLGPGGDHRQVSGV